MYERRVGELKASRAPAVRGVHLLVGRRRRHARRHRGDFAIIACTSWRPRRSPVETELDRDLREPKHSTTSSSRCPRSGELLFSVVATATPSSRGWRRQRAETGCRESMLADGSPAGAGSHDAEEQDRGHQKRRQTGRRLKSRVLMRLARASMRAPGTSRTGRRSRPARRGRPCSTMVSAPTGSGHDHARLDRLIGLTTRRRGPADPAGSTARHDDRVRLVSSSTTSRNWPGQSALSALGRSLELDRRGRLIHALFTNVRSPVARVSCWRGGEPRREVCRPARTS